MKNSKKTAHKRKKRVEAVNDYLLNSENVQPDLGKSGPFYKALRKILLNLPEDIMLYINEIWFVIENEPILGFSFYNEYLCHGLKLFPKKLRIYTIVLFHDCLKLSQQALIGFIACQLAGYFSNYRDTPETFEKSESEIIEEWGFSKELDAFKKETNFRSD